MDNETLTLVVLELIEAGETPEEAQRLVALLAEEYGHDEDE